MDVHLLFNVSNGCVIRDPLANQALESSIYHIFLHDEACMCLHGFTCMSKCLVTGKEKLGLSCVS